MCNKTDNNIVLIYVISKIGNCETRDARSQT